MKKKNKHAQMLGRLGGKKTALRGSDYFKKISKLGVMARQAQRLKDKKEG